MYAKIDNWWNLYVLGKSMVYLKSHILCFRLFANVFLTLSETKININTKDETITTSQILCMADELSYNVVDDSPIIKAI